MSESLYQQPGRVAAGTRALFEGLLTCLNARIEPRHIFNFLSYPPIQVNQKADRCLRLAGRLPKKSLEQRPGWLDRTIGFEILSQLRSVLERVVFDSWFQKEIERIERG